MFWVSVVNLYKSLSIFITITFYVFTSVDSVVVRLDKLREVSLSQQLVMCEFLK